MKVPVHLRGRKGVVFDTMLFIYLFEDHPKYAPICELLVRQAAAGVFSGIITPITAAEVLVKPLEKNLTDIADRYRLALMSMRHIQPVEITLEAGFVAAALRAKYKLPLPDMIQIALAMQMPSPMIITNDKVLRKITELEVVLLDEMVT